MASCDLQICYWVPFGRYCIIELSWLYLGFVLSIIASKYVNFLTMVNWGKEISKSWHLYLIWHEFLILENPEVVSLWTTQKIVFVASWDEYHWKMQWKLFGLVPHVDFPFLPVNTKATDRRPSKLEPVTTLVQHQSGIFVVIIFRRPRLHLFFNYLFLRNEFFSLSRRHYRKSLLCRSCCAIDFWVFGNIIVIFIVKFDELV